MTHHKSRLRTLAISGLLAALAPLPAFAQSADEVAARLKAMFEKQGVQASWDDVSGSGSSVMLQGVTMSAPGEQEEIAIGDLDLEDVRQDGETIIVGTLTLPTYSFSGEGVEVDMSDMSISGLRLPPQDTTDTISDIAVYDSADIGSLNVSYAGKDVFSLQQLHTEMTGGDGTPFAFSGAAERFSADLSSIEDAKTKAALASAGYETLAGTFEMAGSWDPQSGRLSLDQYDIAVDDAGTLGFTFEITGYTPQFIAALREMQTKMAETEGQDNSAQGMAMLGLMQQLNLHGATLRFDDNTLTQKVLQYFASQQGAQPADIANQAKAVLPFAMMQVGNPELTAEVSAAVNAFLDNPESLEIRVEPENPLPFAMIAASAMTAPTSLPQQLGVGVSAND